MYKVISNSLLKFLFQFERSTSNSVFQATGSSNKICGSKSNGAVHKNSSLPTNIYDSKNSDVSLTVKEHTEPAQTMPTVSQPSSSTKTKHSLPKKGKTKPAVTEKQQTIDSMFKVQTAMLKNKDDSSSTFPVVQQNGGSPDDTRCYEIDQVTDDFLRCGDSRPRN